ncbi:inorganic pyrophosphatase, partial [Coccomyxa subellipsoidea C-169]
VSPWHDVALRNEDGTLNFVCEIPKDTSAKFEVATGEERNPIKQDVKKGVPRFYPYTIPWNYGMLPQTWEDPQAAHADIPGVGGDNDPVDVVEIGGTPLETAGVYTVKALGAYAMIDSGELDWKIICIRSDHPLAPKLNDITDVERELPGELEKIMMWFRDYKIPDGKPPNAFGFDSKPVNESYAQAVVEETHQAYSQLHSGARPNDGELSLR